MNLRRDVSNEGDEFWREFAFFATVLAALYESRERPTEESKVEEYVRPRAGLHVFFWFPSSFWILTLSHLVVPRFLRKHMGEIVGVDYDAMKKENEELKRKNAQLTKRVEELERAQDQ